MLTVCIAGKNEIAINGLNYLIKKYKNKIKICALPNPEDSGIDTWKKSFRKFCLKKNVKITNLSKLYKIKKLLFLSLEYSKIIDTDKFISNQLFNIHFSLLPKYRGMYTSVWPILNGDKYAGTTLHVLDKSIDGGNIISQKKFKISDTITSRTLYKKHMNNAFLLFKKNIKLLINNKFKKYPQKLNKGSYHSKNSLDFKKININFKNSAIKVSRQFRAFIFKEYQLPKFKNYYIKKIRILKTKSNLTAGKLISDKKKFLIISTIDFNVKLYKDC